MTRAVLDHRNLRAALWTAKALREARRNLRLQRVEAATVSAPPPLPASAERGVFGYLRRSRGTCLERALVLQRWYAAHDRPREIVIGVRGSTDDFTAHAWLDGDPDGERGAFRELLRLPPR